MLHKKPVCIPFSLLLWLQFPRTKLYNMLNHLLSVSLALLAASAPILSSPLRSRTEYAVKDTHNVPRQWYQVGPAPKHKLLNLHISLKQSRFDELERHLYEGKCWLSKSQLSTKSSLTNVSHC